MIYYEKLINDLYNTFIILNINNGEDLVMKKKLLAILLFSLGVMSYASEQTVDFNTVYKKKQVVLVVPENLHAKYMPELPELTKTRLNKRKLKKSKTTEEAMSLEDEQMYEEKYQKAMRVLSKDNVFQRIKTISAMYDVEPVHVAGAIIGEHTFNVDILDKVQNYIGLMYKGWLKYFDRNDIKFKEFLKLPEIKAILENKTIIDYEKWNKIGEIFESKYSGKNGYPGGSFLMAFFDPLGSGKSYGLGQLSPLRVLMANDIAHKYGKVPYIQYDDTERLYNAVLDRDLSIHYVCATIWLEIKYYKEEANFDLSKNPGMTATLYNIGFEKRKSEELYKKNVLRLSKNQPILYPQENYYGWYINSKKSEILKELNTAAN